MTTKPETAPPILFSCCFWHRGKGSRFTVHGSPPEGGKRFNGSGVQGIKGSRFIPLRGTSGSGFTVQRFSGSAVHTPAGYKRFRVQGSRWNLRHY